jgi:hypothetical protein
VSNGGWDDELERDWDRRTREQDRFHRVLVGVLVVVVLAAIALAIAFNWWRHEYNDVVNVNH